MNIHLFSALAAFTLLLTAASACTSLDNLQGEHARIVALDNSNRHLLDGRYSLGDSAGTPPHNFFLVDDHFSRHWRELYKFKDLKWIELQVLDAHTIQSTLYTGAPEPLVVRLEGSFDGDGCFLVDKETEIYGLPLFMWSLGGLKRRICLHASGGLVCSRSQFGSVFFVLLPIRTGAETEHFAVDRIKD